MFTKSLFLNFNTSSLKPELWNRVNRLSKQSILCSQDSPEAITNLPSTDCLVLRLGMTADKVLLDKMPNLRYIGMYGTGFGRIDTAYAKKRGITVCNIADYATEGVAEFVFGALLEQFRKIAQAKMQAKNNNYSEASFTGTELAGKTFGVIGAGHIGSRVAKIAQALGCKTIYWSRTRKSDLEKIGILYTPIHKLLKASQVISLHLAYNPKTKGFIDERKLRLINPGSVIINTAPMELVAIDVLKKRLKRNDITFILDHSDELKLNVAKQLSKFKNCILYPPIAYTTQEATDRKQEIFVRNLESFLKGKPTNVVN